MEKFMSRKRFNEMSKESQEYFLEIGGEILDDDTSPSAKPAPRSVMSRYRFDSLPEDEKSSFIAAGGYVTD